LIVRAGGAVAPIFRERLSAQTCFPKSAANDARTDGRTSRRDVKRVRIRCILFVSSAEERTQFLDSIGRAFLFAPLFTESVPPPSLSLSLSLSLCLCISVSILCMSRELRKFTLQGASSNSFPSPPPSPSPAPLPRSPSPSSEPEVDPRVGNLRATDFAPRLYPTVLRKSKVVGAYDDADRDISIRYLVTLAGRKVNFSFRGFIRHPVTTPFVHARNLPREVSRRACVGCCRCLPPLNNLIRTKLNVAPPPNILLIPPGGST